jgi:CcmD family protein
MRRLLQLIATVVLLVSASHVTLFGQDPASEFVPVAPGDLQQEQIPAANLVFAAYAFVWVAFVIYLFVLWQRLRKVEVELGEVRSKLGGRR